MKTLRSALIFALLAALAAPVAAAPLGSPGVRPKRITIGIHAPTTGAAPIPADSAEKGADLFFRWLERKGTKIHGRYVDVVFKNDNFNPTQAVAVCKEMVEQDSVFLLVGVVGGDQIQACARYAEGVGVPYISWGGTELGMRKMPRYFATSMSLDRQARLIADLLVARHDAKNQQNAIVWTNTASHQGVRDRFVAAMEKRGAEVHLDRPYPKTAGQSEATAIATEMRAAGIDNAFYLGRPTFWLQLENASRNQGESVQWASVASMMGTDAAVRTMCRSGSGLKASALSYVPAFQDRLRFDPRHDKAMQAEHGEVGDDTTWAGWAMGRNIAKMLRASPRRLTRKTFTRSVTDAVIRTGIAPRLPYRGRGSFAARQAHLLEADCSLDRWVTKKAFASGF